MANFAVLDGENVLNTILADSKTIAEEVTGKTCVEFTTERAEAGGTYVGGVFIPRKPYASWVLKNQMSGKHQLLAQKKEVTPGMNLQHPGFLHK
jgi:hypothetical protein